MRKEENTCIDPRCHSSVQLIPLSPLLMTPVPPPGTRGSTAGRPARVAAPPLGQGTPSSPRSPPQHTPLRRHVQNPP